MGKNESPQAIGARKGAVLLAAAVAIAMLAALMATAPAWASSPSGASVTFWKYHPETVSARPAATVQANEKVGYEVSFISTSALSGGTAANDSVTISAPAGTVLPAGSTEYGFSNDTTNHGYSFGGARPVLTDGGATVTLSLANNPYIDVRAGDRVSVSIGLFGPSFVTNPPEPGQYTLDVRTSSDSTPATSAPYTIAPDTTIPPVLNLPADITTKATGPNGAVVTYDATATDGNTNVDVTCSKSSGDTFPVGTTTVNCSATDALGNQSTGSFQVSVFYDFGNGSGGGFAEPVRAMELNQMKAGQAVPVKFGLGGDLGLSIFASGYPTAKRIDCQTGMPSDPVEETVTASTSGLRYDAASGLYSYVWKTQKSWSGTCRELNLRLADGKDLQVYFYLK